MKYGIQARSASNSNAQLTQRLYRHLAFEPLECRRLLAVHSGPALLVDGVDDYASAADNNTLDLGVADGEDFTVEASFYVADTNDDDLTALVTKDWAYQLAINFNSGSSDYVFLNIWSSPGDLGKYQLGVSADLSEGWHHIAAIFDNDYTVGQDLFAIYLDGIRPTYATNVNFAPGIYNSTSALNVGGYAGAGSLDGFMDEVRFSNLVRYSGSSYTVPAAPFTNDASTQTLWHFDEAPGSTSFADASGKGNMLPAVNGAQTSNPPAVDTTPPTVSSLSPADDAGGVVAGANLVIDFNENIKKGAGNIVIRKSSDDSIVETIAATSAQVTISNDLVTIDPSSDFAAETGYYVQIDSGAFEDLAGNDYVGISDGTEWNFTVPRLSVVYVDDDSLVSNPDGFSWDWAYPTLEAALSYARTANADTDPTNDVTEIRLAGGTYVPTALSDADLDGTIDTDPRSATFSLVDNVSICGGYAGLTPLVGDTADTRDTLVYVTTLSGDLNGDDAPEIGVADLLTHATRNDNAYTVVTGTGVHVALDGLAIVEGNAYATSFIPGRSMTDGGAIYLRGAAEVSLVDVFISNNSAANDGGGIYKSDNSTLTVLDSIILDNAAGSGGGGIYNFYLGALNSGRLTVTGSAVWGNTATYGAGICNDYGAILTVTDTTITDNLADEYGGGIYNTYSATVTGSVISGNSAGFAGGGIYNSSSAPLTVTRSTLVGNLAGRDDSEIYSIALGGGGICNYSGTLTVAGSVVSGNSTAFEGGGIRNSDTMTVTNSTITGNFAKHGGGISYADALAVTDLDALTLTNSIVAMNVASSDSDIKGPLNAESGFNLIGIDPQFVRAPASGPDGTWGTADDDGGDLRLTAQSPAVNMGSSVLVSPELTADLDGQNRIYGGRVDIGAYEYQADPPTGRETPSSVVTTVFDNIDLYDGTVSLREALFYLGGGSDRRANHVRHGVGRRRDRPDRNQSLGGPARDNRRVIAGIAHGECR